MKLSVIPLLGLGSGRLDEVLSFNGYTWTVWRDRSRANSHIMSRSSGGNLAKPVKVSGCLSRVRCGTEEDML